MKKHIKYSVLTAAFVAMSVPMSGIAGDHKGGRYMKMVDTNSDGQISAQEHADAAAKRFARMDADGNGFVTKEEMKAMHKKYKEHKKDK